MRTLLLITALVSTSACKKKDGANMSSEEAYRASEITQLEQAVAAGSETDVTIGCISVRVNLERATPATIAKVDKLCNVDMPTLLLRNAIADTTKRKAETPELGDLFCMQLFVKDAFKATARNKVVPPELAKLVDDYTKLCPAEAAKARAN